MATNKLVKQLSCEIAAHKPKTAALGVMLLVAVYFWAPLMAGWLGGSTESASTSAPGAPVVKATVQVAADDHAAPAVDPLPSWRDLVEQFAKNPMMQSATRPVGRSPFYYEEPKKEQQPDEIVKPTPTRPKQEEIVTPQQLGVILNGTLVGDHRSMAQINGNYYVISHNASRAAAHRQTGDNTVVHETEDGELFFKIVAIRSATVILERNGTQFVLNMKQPAIAVDDQFTIHSSINR